MKVLFLRTFRFVLVWLLLGYSSTYAQRDNVWVFGKGVGLDFNAGNPPSGIYTSIYNPEYIFYMASGIRSNPTSWGEAGASVCDENGSLLFYTSGERIWDRNGNIMPNGDSLTRFYRHDTTTIGTESTVYTNEFVASSAQGALIVPFPNNSQKYYVFSLTSAELDQRDGIGGLLFYHVVDMQLNNGMGDVIAGQKRIFVDSGFTEQMTSVAGDDCNIWVVLSTLRPAKPGVEFKVFEVNANGLNPNPVISNPGVPPGAYLRGSFISISPNRKKLVATRDIFLSGNAELYDFDPLTGSVSNQIILFPNANAPCYGASFSPNSEKVYITTVYPPMIYQYDISSNNASAIIASEIKLNTKIGNSSGFSALKLGPDEKIYYMSESFIKPSACNPLGRSQYAFGIGAINFPNLSGGACQPQDSVTSIKYRWNVCETINGVVMQTDDSILAGVTFTNVISTIRRNPDTLHTVTDTFICSNKGVLVIQSPMEDVGNTEEYIWDDGSAGRTRSVTTTGTFWVQSSDYCRTRIDTFKVELVELEQPVISVNGFELSAGQGYASYQWLLNGREIPGATGRTYTVTENGDYRVVVTGGRGCIDTSDIYKVENVSIDDVTALSRSIKIYPNPVQDRIFINAPVPVNVRISGMEGKLIKEAFSPVSIAVDKLPQGIYMLHIIDEQGRVVKTDKFVKEK